MEKERKMKTINLEDIISNSAKESWVEEHYLMQLTSHQMHYVKRAMKEFGKQLLKLANENAKIINDYSDCGNTGSEYPPDQIISSKSILDTINQVE